MSRQIWTLFGSLAWIFLTISGNAKATAAESVAFTPQTDFWQLPAGWTLGNCSAVGINSRDEIFLFHRGPHPIIVCDSRGKYLRSWGDDVIGSAHGFRIDRNDNVWVTDIGNHRVFQFDAQGKLLLTLGSGQAGDGKDQFNKPTDIAFGPRDEVYVTDGYGNGRVMKFSPHGGLVGSWGKIGQQPGEFRIPHAIVIDRQGRLLVGDRENDRIQVFDSEGKLLDIWTGFAPFGMALDGTGQLYVADGRAHQILRLDASGHVQQRWGKQGKAPGEFDLPHMLTADKSGNLFVGEITGKRFQRFFKQ